MKHVAFDRDGSMKPQSPCKNGRGRQGRGKQSYDQSSPRTKFDGQADARPQKPQCTYCGRRGHTAQMCYKRMADEERAKTKDLEDQFRKATSNSQSNGGTLIKQAKINVDKNHRVYSTSDVNYMNRIKATRGQMAESSMTRTTWL
mmetsp:Transcript_8364/g.21544  ORF Transcript_8364/g.21544 Transcript_8364/m.21544 type:complete len:145 (-) Transcript_8364:412-846(-)